MRTKDLITADVTVDQQREFFEPDQISDGLFIPTLRALALLTQLGQARRIEICRAISSNEVRNIHTCLLIGIQNHEAAAQLPENKT